jgi:hypothetical protein
MANILNIANASKVKAGCQLKLIPILVQKLVSSRLLKNSFAVAVVA